MLIPIGVIFYTAAGGLKATFIASYVHTAIIYIVLVTFTMLVYAASDDLGSPGKVWDNLNFLFGKGQGAPDGGAFRTIEDNRKGHPLTMQSEGGLIFGVINIIGNFGTVRTWGRRGGVGGCIKRTCVADGELGEADKSLEGGKGIRKHWLGPCCQ